MAVNNSKTNGGQGRYVDEQRNNRMSHVRPIMATSSADGCGGNSEGGIRRINSNASNINMRSSIEHCKFVSSVIQSALAMLEDMEDFDNDDTNQDEEEEFLPWNYASQ